VEGDGVMGVRTRHRKGCLGKRCSVVNVHEYHSHIPSPFWLLGWYFLCKSRVYRNENVMNRLCQFKAVLLACSRSWGTQSTFKAMPRIAVTPWRGARVQGTLNAPSPGNCSPRTRLRAVSLLLLSGLHFSVVVPASSEHPLPRVSGRHRWQLSK